MRQTLRPWVALLVAALLVGACTQQSQPTITIFHAAYSGDVDQLERHLHWETPLDQRDPQGLTALHIAAGLGRLIIARALIKAGADTSLTDPDGHTALDRAVLNARLLVVREMLTGNDPATVLELARLQAANGVADKRILAELLQRGLDINAIGADGDGLLHLATRGGHRLMVHLLLNNGADPVLANANGETAADIARGRADDTLYRILTER